jgi:hypothetical protein
LSKMAMGFSFKKTLEKESEEKRANEDGWHGVLEPSAVAHVPPNGETSVRAQKASTWRGECDQ